MKLTDFSYGILRTYLIYLIWIPIVGLLWGMYTSAAPYLLKIIIDRLFEYELIQPVYMPVFIYVCMYCFITLMFRVLDWAKYKMLPSIKKDIAMQMFDHIKYHSHHFFQNNFSGSMSKKVDDMIANIDSLLSSFDEFFAIFSSFLIAIIVMFTVNPIFSLAFFSWCALFLMVSISFSKRILHLSKEKSESFAKYSGKLVDIFSNLSSVRLFARYQHETQVLSDSIDDLCKKDRDMLRYVMIMRLVQDMTFVGALASMFFILLYLYDHQLVTVGDFAFIITVTISMFQSMWYLASKIVDVYKSIGQCHQAMTVIQAKHDVIDYPNAAQLIVTDGLIEFKNVNFSYENSPQLFNNLNVSIQPGSKIGLVGYSGGGKSTFVNLILRLYDVDSGDILIDHQAIKQITQQSLRQQISMIPQDVTLFHRSLMENIKYGNIDASESEVIAASKQAHCHDFIKNLEFGYDTQVGERGIKLSGGQRQRIAIARSFLENGPILILDEATSALDSITEQYIQHSLHLMMNNRTTIVIAHRLSTLLEMDRILVFHNGEIVEDGSHDKLIQANKHYASMWARQSEGFLPNDDS